MNQLSDLSPASQPDTDNLKATFVASCLDYRRLQPKGHRILKRNHREALKALRQNPDIIISRPDKGTGVVIMDKIEYTTKLETILADETKFQKLPSIKDDSEKIEKQLSATLKQMLNQNIIDSTLYYQLKPLGSSFCRLYGLLKIRKSGVPLRPILDMSTSPYHQTAKWLTDILEPVREKLCKHSLKDSFSFVEEVKNLDVTGKFMLSLDVTSLFTNVPVLETVNFICDYVEQNRLELGIPISYLKELLLRCTFGVNFLFNNVMYRQIDGISMGSPLGPILADIFMAKIENTNLAEQISKLHFYSRYVDDTFILCDTKVDTNELLSTFNGAHSSLKFTMEKESNGEIPFLDVLLRRRPDGSLQRRVYHKSTWSGQYLHFKSFTPLKYKRNLVRTLSFRTRKICSSDTLDDGLAFLCDTLLQNGYPNEFIKRNMKERLPKERHPYVPKKMVFITLPFKGDEPSERFSIKLTKAVQTAFPAADITFKFYSRPIVTLSLKDKLPRSSTSFVIYRFGCSSCGASYVGRTTRKLSRRIQEHKPAWYSRGEIRETRSSILAHLIDSGHTIHVEWDFTILHRVPNVGPKGLRQRLLNTAEAVAIRLRKPSLCKQQKLDHTLLLSWPDSCISSPIHNRTSEDLSIQQMCSRLRNTGLCI